MYDRGAAEIVLHQSRALGSLTAAQQRRSERKQEDEVQTAANVSVIDVVTIGKFVVYRGELPGVGDSSDSSDLTADSSGSDTTDCGLETAETALFLGQVLKVVQGDPLTAIRECVFQVWWFCRTDLPKGMDATRAGITEAGHTFQAAHHPSVKGSKARSQKWVDDIEYEALLCANLELTGKAKDFKRKLSRKRAGVLQGDFDSYECVELLLKQLDKEQRTAPAQKRARTTK